MGPDVDRRQLLKAALGAVEDMRARLETAERAASEPIAVIGLGCRMPGGVETPEAFWDLLSGGVDAIREVPEWRWQAERYAAIGPEVAAATPRPRAGFLDRLDAFDAHFFGIAPREAVTMDPQHRMVLETAWEALECAGQAPDRLKGSLTGVFVGITAIDYAVHVRMADPSLLDVYSATGSALNAAAGRLSYVLGLNGPSMSVDTACSSSLTAVHLACQSLRLKESDLALAGGVNTLIIPDWFVSMARWGMLAPDGRCKAFDAGADGMVRAEGCGIVALKRLSDAISAGDRVLAVIRGSAVNQDGPSSGLTVPNGPAQEAVIRQALRAARVKPADISYVEAHGTGTPLGDPIELEAIDAVMGEGRAPGIPLVIGAVKTNIGHLEAASGMAGLIKVILALQHGEIPPNLHFQSLNPAITLSNLQVVVPTAAIPWPATHQPRLAGVSSFGLSGTNAHVVLAEAPAPRPRETERPIHLLAISARSAAALRTQAARWAEALNLDPAVHPGDVAHSANTGRSAFSHRAALVGGSIAQFTGQLAALAAGNPAPAMVTGHVRPKDRPRVAYLFTGQGSQYAGMARELYRAQPVFRESLDRSDALLRSELERPLLSVIHPQTPEDAALINQTAYAQPSLFAIEYALHDLWAAWGIKPAAVMGHSVGEYVAACVAGVFDLEDGLKLIAARGRLMQALPPGGEMAAVMADEDHVRQAVLSRFPDISIAAVNGPASAVISGPGSSVRQAMALLLAGGVSSQPLTVSHAFHSSLMDPMVDAFVSMAGGITFKGPRIPLVSNLMGRVFEDGEIPEAGYWARHLREAVRFADGLKALDARGFTIFLELGPAAVLTGLGRRCLPDSGTTFLPSLRRERSDWHELLASAGQLWTSGAPINWNECDRGFDWRTVSLPTYPFERERYWIDAATDSPAAAARSGRTAAGSDGAAAADPAAHPLLGRRLRSALREVQFEQQLSATAPAFLADHVIHGRVIVPATAFVETCFAAARSLWGPGEHRIGDLVITQPLVLDREEGTLVQTIIAPDANGRASLQVFSCNPADGDQETWTPHVAANLERANKSGDTEYREAFDVVRARCTQPWSAEEIYAWYRARGIGYGARFACLEQVWRGEREAIGMVRWPDSVDAEAATYRLHPAVVDACLQTLAAALPADEGDTTFVPVNIAQVVTHEGCGRIRWSHVRLHPAGGQSDTLIADVSLFDAEQRPVADIRGLRARALSAETPAGIGANLDDSLYEIGWRLADEPGAAAPRRDVDGAWVILGNPDGLGVLTAQRIAEHGGEARLVLAADESNDAADAWRRIDPERQADFDRLGQELAARDDIRGVVHLWSMRSRRVIGDDAQSGGDIASAVRRGCGSLLSLTQAIALHNTGARLVVATNRAQAVDRIERIDAAQAPVVGLARTIRREHPELHCTWVDLETANPTDDVAALWRVLSEPASEAELVVRAGRRYVPRLVRSALRGRLSADGAAPADDVRVLATSSRGVLENVQITTERRRAPGAGEVEIKVDAAALNFRDVLNALGMYPGDPGPLGSECAGTVVRIGPGVERLRAGDEVVGMPAGAFRTYVTATADCFVPKPAALGMEAAATVPIAFLTAEYGLTILGRMRAGDRVLIHAGTGGVGLAAIQLAQAAGAEIFATAGSEEKRAHLRSLGVAHVFSSRTLSFADEILAVTGGAGVEIVLNSLAGDFIAESVRALGHGGQFVEIGKGGIWTAAQMSAARPDVTYLPLYLGDVRPEVTLPMLNRLLADVAAGRLQPLPHRSFALEEGVDAFRHMAQARHIGKVLLACADRPHPVRADATYIVTGGFGALGSAVAQALVAQGARRLVLAGRRGSPDQAAASRIAALEASGVQVAAVSADVTDAAAVAELFRVAAEGPPVRGIVHTAGVVDDGLLAQQSWPQFERVLAPKIAGAWHLHQQSRHCPLDFFVLFSSSASVLPAHGQGNYAAANAFLDALACDRRAAGRPGVSVNWGPWEDLGMTARVSVRDRQRWRRQGVASISEQQGTNLFARLLAEAPPELLVLPVDWRAFVSRYPEAARPALLVDLIEYPLNVPAAASPQTPLLRERLADLPASEWRYAVYHHICEVVRRVLAVSPAFAIEPQQGLRDLGMDSLMAVELRNGLQQSVGRPLPSTLAFDYPAMEPLTDYLMTMLSEDAPTPFSVPDASTDQMLRAITVTEIQDLSDADAEALLAEELNR